MKLSSIEITWIIHATEDEEKVVKKVVELFPLSKDHIKSFNLEGHFSNPILIYKARLTGAEADKFVHVLFFSLSDADKKTLKLELSKHLDEHGAFYIRIDKQLLFESKISISDKDAIKIKLKPKSGLKPHEKLLYYRGLLG